VTAFRKSTVGLCQRIAACILFPFCTVSLICNNPFGDAVNIPFQLSGLLRSLDLQGRATLFIEIRSFSMQLPVLTVTVINVSQYSVFVLCAVDIPGTERIFALKSTVRC
jgi:hypothetical protein